MNTLYKCDKCNTVGTCGLLEDHILLGKTVLTHPENKLLKKVFLIMECYICKNKFAKEVF